MVKQFFATLILFSLVLGVWALSTASVAMALEFTFPNEEMIEYLAGGIAVFGLISTFWIYSKIKKLYSRSPL